MKKRNLIFLSLLLVSLSLNAAATGSGAKISRSSQKVRTYWCDLAYRIAHPVLEALSQDRLKLTMPVEQKEGSRRERVAYLEAMGRTLCGIAPWLELGKDDTREGRMRAELIDLSHKAIRNAVTPGAADYMNFTRFSQPLVDAAFLAQAFIRSPRELWGGLDEDTKRLTVAALKSTRVIKPNMSNWLLFPAEIETFFMMIGEDYDVSRIDFALTKHHEWYKGDGIYGDGPDFHWDYYNSFVIQPMMVDVADVMYKHQKMAREDYERIINRSRRYAEILERQISPEGTFPAVGRSLIYRIGALQSLSMMSWQHRLPAHVSPAQVRCALTAVARRMFGMKGTFTKDGWLTLGFAGHQPGVAEYYVCTGSAYLCTVGFLHLGLPADDSFWIDADAPWTSLKAWSGEDFKLDGACKEKK